MTDLFRRDLFTLFEELCHLDERIVHYDEQIEPIAQADVDVQRPQTSSGIGPKIATALLTALGDLHVVINSR